MIGQRRFSSLKALGGWATSEDGASALATLKIEETDLAAMLAGDGLRIVQKKLVAAGMAEATARLLICLARQDASGARKAAEQVAVELGVSEPVKENSRAPVGPLGTIVEMAVLLAATASGDTNARSTARTKAELIARSFLRRMFDQSSLPVSPELGGSLFDVLDMNSSYEKRSNALAVLAGQIGGEQIMPLVHIAKLLLLERAKDAMEDDATAAASVLASDAMRIADRKAALEASTAMLKQLLPKEIAEPLGEVLTLIAPGPTDLVVCESLAKRHDVPDLPAALLHAFDAARDEDFVTLRTELFQLVQSKKYEGVIRECNKDGTFDIQFSDEPASISKKRTREDITLVDDATGDPTKGATVEAYRPRARSGEQSNVLAGDMLLALYVLKHGRDIDIVDIAHASGLPPDSSPMVRAIRAMMQPGAYGAGDMFGTNWAASHLDAIRLIGERLSIPKARCPLLHELLLLATEAVHLPNGFVEIAKVMRLETGLIKSVIAIARVVGAVPEDEAARKAAGDDTKTREHVKQLAILALGAMRDAGKQLTDTDIAEPVTCSSDWHAHVVRSRRVSKAEEEERKRKGLKKKGKAWEKQVKDTFMKLSNGDGYLDENEILFLLRELKLDLNKSKEVEKQQVRAMIALFENPGARDGKLDEQEFLAMMRTVADEHEKGDKNATWIKEWQRQAGFDEPANALVKKLFDGRAHCMLELFGYKLGLKPRQCSQLRALSVLASFSPPSSWTSDAARGAKAKAAKAKARRDTPNEMSAESPTDDENTAQDKKAYCYAPPTTVPLSVLNTLGEMLGSGDLHEELRLLLDILSGDPCRVIFGRPAMLTCGDVLAAVRLEMKQGDQLQFATDPTSDGARLMRFHDWLSELNKKVLDSVSASPRKRSSTKGPPQSGEPTRHSGALNDDELPPTPCSWQRGNDGQTPFAASTSVVVQNGLYGVSTGLGPLRTVILDGLRQNATEVRPVDDTVWVPHDSISAAARAIGTSHTALSNYLNRTSSTCEPGIDPINGYLARSVKKTGSPTKLGQGGKSKSFSSPKGACANEWGNFDEGKIQQELWDFEDLLETIFAKPWAPDLSNLNKDRAQMTNTRRVTMLMRLLGDGTTIEALGHFAGTWVQQHALVWRAVVARHQLSDLIGVRVPLFDMLVRMRESRKNSGVHIPAAQRREQTVHIVDFLTHEIELNLNGEHDAKEQKREKSGMMRDMRRLLELCAKTPVDCELLHGAKDDGSNLGVKLVLEPVSRAIAERAAEGGLYASALPYLKMAAALAKSIESFVLTEHKNKTKKGFFGGGGDTADTKVPAADNNLDAEPKEGADKGDDDEADDEDESSPSVLFPLLTVAIRSRAPALQTPRPSRKLLKLIDEKVLHVPVESGVLGHVATALLSPSSGANAHKRYKFMRAIMKELYNDVGKHFNWPRPNVINGALAIAAGVPLTTSNLRLAVHTLLEVLELTAIAPIVLSLLALHHRGNDLSITARAATELGNLTSMRAPERLVALSCALHGDAIGTRTIGTVLAVDPLRLVGTLALISPDAKAGQFDAFITPVCQLLGLGDDPSPALKAFDLMRAELRVLNAVTAAPHIELSDIEVARATTVLIAAQAIPVTVAGSEKAHRKKDGAGLVTSTLRIAHQLRHGFFSEEKEDKELGEKFMSAACLLMSATLGDGHALEDLAYKLSNSEEDLFRLDAAELSKLLRSVVARFSLEARYAAIREMDASGDMQTVSEVEAETDTTTHKAQARSKKRAKADLTKAIFLANVGAESDLNSKVATLLLRLARIDTLFGVKDNQEHAHKLSKSRAPIVRASHVPRCLTLSPYHPTL